MSTVRRPKESMTEVADGRLAWETSKKGCHRGLYPLRASQLRTMVSHALVSASKPRRLVPLLTFTPTVLPSWGE